MMAHLVMVHAVMKIESGTTFTLAEDASIQNIGEEAVILLANSGQLYTCNDSTEAFLTKVDGARNLGDIVELLSVEYDADRDTLMEDMEALAAHLVAEGVLASPK